MDQPKLLDRTDLIMAAQNHHDQDGNDNKNPAISIGKSVDPSIAPAGRGRRESDRLLRIVLRFACALLFWIHSPSPSKPRFIRRYDSFFVQNDVIAVTVRG